MWFTGHEASENSAVCLDLFGLDGREESLRDTIDLKVTVGEAIQRIVFQTCGRLVTLLGREIAAPRPGRGLKFLKDRPFCRRSVKTYLLSIPNGSVFMMQAVPSFTLDRLVASIGEAGSVRVA